MNKDDFYKLTLKRSREGNPLFSPILMQFAAHEVHSTYSNFYLNHDVLVEANLFCQKKYHTDTVSLISDPGREAEGFGARFSYAPERVPHCTRYVLENEDDPAFLRNPDPRQAERMNDRLEAAKRLRMEKPENVPLIGWVEGPMASACDIMELSEVLVQMMTEPEKTRVLLEKTLQTAKDFSAAQIDAGCDIIGIGDAICSQIGAGQYNEFVQPLHRELVRFIQDRGAMAKIHICGNITHLLGGLKEVGMDILDLDWEVDLEKAYAILGNDVIRCGNIDPAAVIERGTPGEIRQKVKELIEREKGRPFILSAGCEITPLTPEENLLAMIKREG
ncbi:MAG: uroporphyrinogen decarboxylase family protein [Spirochaetales bacterium]|nr:uroporphyrinogen decarboxylase family protein [Spirochaetales bacterium]